MGTSQKKKANPKQLGPKPNPPPEIQAASFSSPPILTQPLPSTSNPFESLEEEHPSSPHSPPDPQDPPLPESQCQNTIESSLPLTISSQTLLDPPLNRITRSSSKDHGGSSEPSKKPGPGKKSVKQHRDENAQKDIAPRTQTPLQSFIHGHQEKEISGKDQER